MELLFNGATSQFATSVSSLLVEQMAKAFLLLGLIGLITLAMRKTSAATRHLLWAAGLACTLLLPLGMFLPNWSPANLIRSETNQPEQSSAVDRLPRAEVVAERSPLSVTPIPTTPPNNEQMAETAAETEPAFSPSLLPSPSTPTNWSNWTVAVWALGVFSVLLYGLIGIGRLAWLKRHAKQITDRQWKTLCGTVAGELGTHNPPMLLEGIKGQTPMTWGTFNPVILLPAGSYGWPENRKRDILLHELSHVARRDHAVQLVSMATAAIQWFNPLVWVAVWRLRVESELAADDMVLSTGRKSSGYAESILTVARYQKSAQLAVGVPALGRSRLRNRLRRMLLPDVERTPMTRKRAYPILLLTGLFFTPIGVATTAADSTTSVAGTIELETKHAANTPRLPPPTTVIQTVEPPPASTSATQDIELPFECREPNVARSAFMAAVMDEASRQREVNRPTSAPNGFRWGGFDCSVDIHVAGDVNFNDGFDDLDGISPRGYFEVDFKKGDLRRQIEFTSDRLGRIDWKWMVDGEEAAFDSAARQEFTQILTEVFRGTHISATERATWILNNFGVDSLLEEIDQLRTGIGRRLYLTALLNSESVDDNDRIVSAERVIPLFRSQGELAVLLEDMAVDFQRTPELRAAFFPWVATIEADVDAASILTTALQANPAAALQVLEVSTTIDAVDELTALLIRVGATFSVDQTLPSTFVPTLSHLRSDQHRLRVLRSLLVRQPSTPAFIGSIMEAATALEVEETRAELVLSAIARDDVDSETRAAWFQGISDLSSSYQRARVIARLLETATLDNETAIKSVRHIGNLESDHDKVELLTLLCTQQANPAPGNADIQAAFTAAVATIESDYEKARTQSRLIFCDRRASGVQQVGVIRPPRPLLLKDGARVKFSRDNTTWQYGIVSGANNVNFLCPTIAATNYNGQPLARTERMSNRFIPVHRVSALQISSIYHAQHVLGVVTLFYRAGDDISGERWTPVDIDEVLGTSSRTCGPVVPARELQISQTSPDTRTPLVVLAPGHGGEYTGSILDGGVAEKIVNLEAAQRIAVELTSQGFRVLVKPQIEPGRGVRIPQEFARSNDAIALVSIHVDPSHSNRPYNSLSMYTFPSDTASQRFASILSDQLLVDEIVESVYPRQSRFAVLRPPAVPAVLIQFNVNEPRLRDASFHAELGIALGKALRQL